MPQELYKRGPILICLMTVLFDSGLRPDAANVVLKNPWDTGRAPDILRLFPGTRFIYIRRSPMRILNEQLGEGLEPGQIGVIVAKPGVGKSPLLVHIALDALLQDIPVLHVALKDPVDHVRSYYDEIFGAITRAGRIADRAAALVAIERHRMIHSYLDRTFDVGHLADNLRMLDEVAHFVPRLLVLDGLRAKDLGTTLPSLSALLTELGVPMWATVRTRTNEDPQLPPEAWEHVKVVLKLTPTGRTVKLSLVRPGEVDDLPFLLDPSTMLVLSGEQDEAGRVHIAPRPGDCTLYSARTGPRRCSARRPRSGESTR